jgi:hypothetical protein
MFYVVFVYNYVDWLYWDFYVLCNSFPSHINVFSLLSKFLKAANLCENLIWYLSLNYVLFNFLCLNILRVPFTYWKSVTKIGSLQIVIRVMVRSSEWSDLKNTWMQSPNHMWSNSESLTLVSPVIFKNISMSEYSVLNRKFLGVSKFSTLKLSYNTFVQTPIPYCLFANIFTLKFCIKTSEHNFIRYLWK